MSTTMTSRMGRNPFGKSGTEKRSAVQELREETRKEAFEPSAAEAQVEGVVEWAAVELPARIYLTVLNAWLSWM